MELGSIIHFFGNKSILVTGATGFLAKIFVEKVLRVIPNVKKLYLLLRASDTKSALQRFNNEVTGKDLFKVLKEKMGANMSALVAEKVTIVPGDITKENLGVDDPNLMEEMLKQVDIVVNLAATTNFDERYDVALGINTLGARRVLHFANNCANLKVLCHVSTAYVSGERGGLILESPYKLGQSLNGTTGLDIDAEVKVIDNKLDELRSSNATDKEIRRAMKDLGHQRARQYGWPNTYVFTKAMGEMVLGDLRRDLPLVIARPAIVTSTYKDPFPGWVEGVRTIDSLAVGYAKGQLTCFLGDPDAIIDVIPADMVVNAMLVAMVANAKERTETIYHLGSSIANPVTFRPIQEYGHRYFSKHPWINKDGKPVIVGHVTVLNSMDSFHRYFSLRYLLPLKGLQLVNTALCQYFQSTYLSLRRKIDFILRLIEIYEPYLFFKGIFDDMNTEKLRRAARENKEVEWDLFYFDPKCINWEDYFMNTHIPGVVKYVFR